MSVIFNKDEDRSDSFLRYTLNKPDNLEKKRGRVIKCKNECCKLRRIQNLHVQQQ